MSIGTRVKEKSIQQNSTRLDFNLPPPIKQIAELPTFWLFFRRKVKSVGPDHFVEIHFSTL